MRRWNAAIVFAAPPADKHVEAALETLPELARDQRRLVWTAVSSALRNLVRRDPGRVAPALRAWLNDDRKLPAALALPPPPSLPPPPPPPPPGGGGGGEAPGGGGAPPRRRAIEAGEPPSMVLWGP